jgi:hypothetical protein
MEKQPYVLGWTEKGREEIQEERLARTIYHVVGHVTHPTSPS